MLIGLAGSGTAPQSTEGPGSKVDARVRSKGSAMTVTNRSGGLSQRTFLRGSAIATTGISLLEATSAFVKQAEADSASPVVGPDATPITLNINGVVRTLDVAPNMTLAEVLRDPLGFAQENAHPEFLLARADQALYAAKHTGRDRVVSADKVLAAFKTSQPETKARVRVS